MYNTVWTEKEGHNFKIQTTLEECFSHCKNNMALMLDFLLLVWGWGKQIDSVNIHYVLKVRPLSIDAPRARTSNVTNYVHPTTLRS